MAGSSSAATRGTTGGKKRTSPVKPSPTTDTFSQPKLTFSSKPRQDQHSYFLSPSPPRPQPKSQRIKKNITASSSSTDRNQAPPSQLWVDRFPPTTTASLAVHRAKIDQVRTWLSEALTAPPSIRAYRRLLVLTGPSGSGKSATIRALSSSQELDFDIVEWENTWGNNIGAEFTPSSQAGPSRFVSTSQSATQLFADFLASSSRFGTLEMASDQPDDNTGGDGPTATARPVSTPTASTSTLPTTSQLLMPPPPLPQPPSSQSTDTKNKTRRIILLDDLPNLSHPPTRLAFQSTLASLLSHTQAQSKQQKSNAQPPPIVLLLSDSTGREADASVASDALVGRSSAFSWRRDEELNLRSVLGDELRRDPRVVDIKFNPVAPTILKKALVRILDLVHTTSTPSPSPTRSRTTSKRDKPFEAELIKLLSDADGSKEGEGGDHNNAKRTAIERPTGGDLRSAITQMQFVLECPAPSSFVEGVRKGAKRDRKGTVVKGKGREIEEPKIRARKILASVSRRESNLPLFHAVGRVLYNKRLGDPGGSDDESSAPLKKSNKGRKVEESSEEEEDGGEGGKKKKGGLWARLRRGEKEEMWTDLPEHWKELDRRPSKINLEALWAQSPVDPSLLQLYLHHNFPSFCSEIEECSAGLEYISSADSDLRIWTESWTHTSLSAYYAFLLSTGGILLTLPSPIPPVRPTTTSSFRTGAGAGATPMNGRTRHRQLRKSAFFDGLKRTREMGEELDDVAHWILRSSVGSAEGARPVGGGLLAGFGGGGVRTELSSLSTVSRTALAVEVVPLLAKMSRLSDAGLAGGSAGIGMRSGKMQVGGAGPSPTQRTQTSKPPRTALNYPPSILHIGQFDHLTASQAAQSAFSLRTDALDDSGLLGGADDDDDVGAAEESLPPAAVSSDGGGGGPTQNGPVWTEQVKAESFSGYQGQEGEERKTEEELDGLLLGDGVREGEGYSGLMDSDDEILSDL
ncbi:hypothetical protein A4X13_0g778 [Tilletia indica]|uniref:AAA+ ATPase domain-containing protein n=1 Tax=Tilletia indica TaxID=43049 RepID=A0A177TR30_9BASI|nr:hypothetical protein A4X13_0g778 [Tilletia indica]